VKISRALIYYRLDLVDIEDLRPLLDSDGASEEIMTIAEELRTNGNPKHVRYATFHLFPRVM
jgi:hypothetical protein